MFISAVVFQNHILQQIEIGRAGWGFGRRPFCFWSAFHDVLFCIRALSPSVKGLNIGTRTRLVFYITFFFFFFFTDLLVGKVDHTQIKREGSLIQKSMRPSNQRAAGHSSIAEPSRLCSLQQGEKYWAQAISKLQGRSFYHTHVCFRHPFSPSPHAHARMHTHTQRERERAAHRWSPTHFFFPKHRCFSVWQIEANEPFNTSLCYAQAGC